MMISRRSTLVPFALFLSFILPAFSSPCVAQEAAAQEAGASKSGADDSAAQAALAEAEASLPPEWFVKHLKTMTESNGRWIANNDAHRSDSEPFDAYGMAWRWGIGKKSATSRLFVVRGGEDLGTLWEHRTAWHPGENKAISHAFGSDGSYGVGTLEPVNEHEIKVVEQFFDPNGSTYSTGHRVIDLGNGEIKMQSFGITPDGRWEPRRTYVWKLEGSETEEEGSDEEDGSDDDAGAEPN